jgi:MHS family proline/betaine transporter-like MFS transporter
MMSAIETLPDLRERWPPRPERPHGGLRVVLAASLGNALEWYDFTIYVLFAAHIARNFFPGGDASSELVKSFLAFGVGFLVRPLGAIVIGLYSDRAGRKAALMLTIGLMAIGTLVIAVAPTYAVLGIGAPLLILVGRVLQGFSAGGEIGGAAAFLVEHAPAGRRGQYAAWLQASMAASNILGALVALAVGAVLTQAQIGEWGWRIPFAVGLVIAPVGLWLRRGLDETPVFAAAEPAPIGAPLMVLFRRHPRRLLCAFAISVLWAVCVYALVIYMPVHVQRTLGFSGSQAFTASLVGNVLLAASCFVSGGLADRVGRRRLLLAAGAMLSVGAPLLMIALQSHPTTMVLIAVQASFCILVGLFSGAVPAALSQLFPTAIRATGVAIAYNAAVTVFGGFAPALLAALAAGPAGALAPAFYVTAAGIVALVGLAALPKDGVAE